MSKVQNEVFLMNKWIPISLLVFLGIYLLTTTPTSITDYPATRIAGTPADESSNFLMAFPQQ
jgi:hypothetical protein